MPTEPTEPGAKPTTVYYGLTWVHVALVCAAAGVIAIAAWQTGDPMLTGLVAAPIALLILFAAFPVIVRKPLLRLRDDSVTVYEAYTGNRVTVPWHDVERLVYWRGTRRLYGAVPVPRGRLGIARQFASPADPTPEPGTASSVPGAKWTTPDHIAHDVAVNSVSTGVLAKRTLLAALAADPRISILDARRAQRQRPVAPR